MPVWDFWCPACQVTKEYTFLTYEASINTKCKMCGVEMERLPASGSFILKGTGFYCNDYKGIREAE